MSKNIIDSFDEFLIDILVRHTFFDESLLAVTTRWCGGSSLNVPVRCADIVERVQSVKHNDIVAVENEIFGEMGVNKTGTTLKSNSQTYIIQFFGREISAGLSQSPRPSS